MKGNKIDGYSRYTAFPDGNIGVSSVIARCGLKNNPTCLKKSKILAPQISVCGYAMVGLTADDGSRKTHLVHKIIAKAFLNFDSTGDMQIDHIDGNKLNNSISNLQVLSRRQNTSKSVKKEGKLTGAFRNGKGWTARASVNNRLVNLGTYETQLEAHAAYLKFTHNG
ncbi:MAG: HNH endonuclease [Prevotellaceae bacterium]|jgi:hypothetical protein|nr:HNH endonuclease [Prevotellaceae bacterium]